MSDYQVSTRFARALFQLAEERQCADVVYREMLNLSALLRDAGAPLAPLITHAALSEAQQRQVLKALFGDRLSPLTNQFLQFLAERRRLSVLPAICEAYDKRYRESRQLLHAEIVGAKDLAPEQVQALSRKLEAKYHMNIEAAVSTDPSLLGGFVVRVADVVHDYSVRGQLDALRTAIMHA